MDDDPRIWIIWKPPCEFVIQLQLLFLHQLLNNDSGEVFPTLANQNHRGMRLFVSVPLFVVLVHDPWPGTPTATVIDGAFVASTAFFKAASNRPIVALSKLPSRAPAAFLNTGLPGGACNFGPR